MPYTYEYRRPAVTVDAVIFGVDLNEPELKILLIKRGHEPFKGQWALPGGFVNVRDDGDQGEDLEAAVRRELREETSVEVDYLEQLGTFGTPNRDPRGRVISVAYYGLVRSDQHRPVGGDDADVASWSWPSRSDALAFDHNIIFKTAWERLQAKVRYAPVGFNLLPKTFTLSELQKLYEAILGRSLDKRNFRRKVLAMPILREAGTREEVNHRPAALYKFDKQSYDQAVKSGFHFDL